MFLSENLIVQHKTTIVSWLFENSSDGPRYGDIFKRLLSKINKNCPFLGDELAKICRGQHLSSNFSAPLLGSKFNVDYDFVIKHAPI